MCPVRVYLRPWESVRGVPKGLAEVLVVLFYPRPTAWARIYFSHCGFLLTARGLSFWPFLNACHAKIPKEKKRKGAQGGAHKIIPAKKRS